MTQAAIILGVVLAVGLQFAACQVSVMRWCTTSSHEEQKCVDMKTAFAANSLKTLNCVAGESASHCMELINTNQADLITLDGGDVYTAGMRFNMIPIMQEVYAGNDKGYYAIAAVRRDNPGFDLRTLRGKKSCHTGVRKTAGWNVPIGYLLQADLINPAKCQDDIRAAGNFFNQSCAPGALSSTYNPDNDNPESLCALCKTTSPVKCPRNSNEPYYNYAGAFRCMAVGDGDVAFIKPQTIDENTDRNNQESWAVSLQSTDFQLLCKDGSRADVGQHMQCNLAYVPSHAVMASKNFDTAVLEDFRTVLKQAQDLFGQDSNTNGFSMFDSSLYDGGSDLLFKDSTESLADVTTDYDEFLGADYMATVKGLEKCPKGSLRWCVTSAQEKTKCEAMTAAFTGANLTPPISCYQSESADLCTMEIADNEADLVSLDGGKLYKHGREGRVAPIMAEDYGSGDASYWAVVVVKRTSTFTINDLKGKKSCHTGYMRTAGWLVAIGFLLNRGDIVSDEKCQIPKAVGEFFSQSCVPGVLDPVNNPSGTNPDNLCELCSGQGDNKCKSNANEPYSGYAGAFRCLVADSGDVAFVKHTTVGSNPDVQKADYQLLCPDGSRAEVDDYLNCNLAKVPSHTVVTAQTKTDAQRREMVTLLKNGQDRFKSDAGAGFKMFDSADYGVGGDDLLFKDSTVQLTETANSYDKFLSKEYLEDTEAIYCEPKGPGGAAGLLPSLLLMLAAVVMHRLARG
ncbi:melanotransferrin-like [Patiria miniata]|uniref:Transferrin-like domain-containing protein n=1 Tax=Patiria miniata TaxID=46514 RepID=A0A914A173_PATMI|nr:melanotransferrin-like [Patiria miniata]XP_038057618.1 melanotransferrin-like [Patiria miniata]